LEKIIYPYYFYTSIFDSWEKGRFINHFLNFNMARLQSVITATGSYLPEHIVFNNDFIHHHFFQKDGSVVPGTTQRNIEKFKEITGIGQRRYAGDEQNASDLAFLAATDALTNAGINKESLDYIIVAHNFGDVVHGSNRINLLPSLATKVKFLLQIKNPRCIAYDLVFGCPGWLQGLIQADYYLRSGDAKRCLVIGTETLSRVIDEYDRDCMIYADGAGAVVVEAVQNAAAGIISHQTQTYASEHAMLLTMDRSYKQPCDNNNTYLKMNGRGVYEFALQYVPQVVKQTLDKAQVHISEIKKVLIHQANEKMDQAILHRLFKLYDINSFSSDIMPMTISWLGNSSVATIPTLLDLIRKDKLDQHQIRPGDKVVFASVGAGMNINALLYQF
jgi:3-oxoacyl-[acyl-carrier-protein] synthase-3